MDLRDPWPLIRRRLPMIGGLTLLGAVLGLGLALGLPPTYESRAVLVVESEQIPDDLAASTVRTGEIEALQIIRQRILSRDVLLGMARELALYDDDSLSADRKVADLRARIEITTPAGPARRGARDATIVTVGFSDADAHRAARTANALVTLILQESVEMRTAVARQTLDFFVQEVTRLEADLAAASDALLRFHEENMEALPDSLAFRRAQQATLQARRLEIARDLTDVQDRRAQQVLLFEKTGQVTLAGGAVGQVPVAGPSRGVAARDLDALRSEYAKLSAVLSERNPRMAVLRSQIAAAEAERASLPAAPNTDPSEPPQDAPLITVPDSAFFEMQLAEMTAAANALEQEQARITEQLAALADSIAATPGNAVALARLERSHANLQAQYNQAVANKARAETGAIIESLSRGQRISVVEQAVAPERPARPNRPLIAGAGPLVGLAAGLALFVVLEMLNRAVRRPQDLQATLGIAPFATLPYVATEAEEDRARQRRLALAGALLIGTVGLLWVADRHLALLAHPTGAPWSSGPVFAASP